MVASIRPHLGDTTSVRRGKALHLVVENSVAIVVNWGLKTDPIADGDACTRSASSLANVL
jgi:hypothetical protein